MKIKNLLWEKVGYLIYYGQSFYLNRYHLGEVNLMYVPKYKWVFSTVNCNCNCVCNLLYFLCFHYFVFKGTFIGQKHQNAFFAEHKHLYRAVKTLLFVNIICNVKKDFQDVLTTKQLDYKMHRLVILMLLNYHKNHHSKDTSWGTLSLMC